MKTRPCERGWELDAYREQRLAAPDALSFERHLHSCSECSERRVTDERLRELARRLPDPAPDALSLRRIRRRVLNETAMAPPRPRSSGRTALALGLALAASMAGLGAVASFAAGHRSPEDQATAAPAPATPAPPSPSALAGTVTPAPGALWSQAREGDLERVRLDDGTIDVHVRRQRPDERFLVAMPDGELEVRGTTFDVVVQGGRTRSVRVIEGVVDLRLAGSAERRLAANEAWSEEGPAPAASDARVAQAAVHPRAAASISTASTASTAPAAAAAEPDDGTSEYSAALTELGAGRNEEAAASLRAYVLAHPRAPQIEDATFLEAVALARAGRVDAAGLAAEEHLARFPWSFHRKEAAILVERAARLREAREGGASATGP